MPKMDGSFPQIAWSGYYIWNLRHLARENTLFWGSLYLGYAAKDAEKIPRFPKGNRQNLRLCAILLKILFEWWMQSICN